MKHDFTEATITNIMNADQIIQEDLPSRL